MTNERANETRVRELRVVARETTRWWVAVLLLLSPFVVVAGLGIDAHLRRKASAASDPAIRTLATRLASPDLALSGGARWLRSISLEEPTAAFSDGPAFPDPDPASAAVAPPVDVWVVPARRSSRTSLSVDRDLVVEKEAR